MSHYLLPPEPRSAFLVEEGIEIGLRVLAGKAKGVETKLVLGLIEGVNEGKSDPSCRAGFSICYALSFGFGFGTSASLGSCLRTSLLA